MHTLNIIKKGTTHNHRQPGIAKRNNPTYTLKKRKPIANNNLHKLVQKLFKAAELPGTGKNIRKALFFSELMYELGGIDFRELLHLKKNTLLTNNTKATSLIYPSLPIPITDRAWYLIEKLKNNDEENPYLFDIISPNITLPEKRRRLSKFIKSLNQNLKKLSEKLKLKTPIQSNLIRTLVYARKNNNLISIS